jgi:hypothetical protein
MTNRSIVTLLLASLMLATGVPASAQQAKCLAGKTKCISKTSTGLLMCEQLAETPGKPANPNANDCVSKVIARFDGGVEPAKGCFEKLENRNPNDCITFDDTGSAETAVDSCVASLVGAIDPPMLDQTNCGGGKTKCVSKYLKGLLRCHQLAQTPGRPNDPNTTSCVTRAQTKYDGGPEPAKGCFEKLENRNPNDCQILGDSATLAGLVQSCVANLIGVVTNTTTSSTGPSSTTTTTTGQETTTTTTLASGCFTDTGEGTIHDTCTALQWEKKTTAVGSGVNAADLHDVDNRYSWAGICTRGGFCQPNAAAAATCAALADGGTFGCSTCASGTCNVDWYGAGAITTVWDWINQLNAANYGGHNDWRVPSEGGHNSPATGAHELETILLALYPSCGSYPCIDPIFEATGGYYWSASTYMTSPTWDDAAWWVSFGNGLVLALGDKANGLYVRAVR